MRLARRPSMVVGISDNQTRLALSLKVMSLFLARLELALSEPKWLRRYASDMRILRSLRNRIQHICYDVFSQVLKHVISTDCSEVRGLNNARSLPKEIG